jgi:hypothetical protein
MKHHLLALICWLWLSVAQAFAPEAGLWAVDSEVNGQPGRGFQIDLQGSTLVLTFYGYNDDGSAQWYLAAGGLNGTDFSASLEKYRGGMAFGRNPAAAVGAGSAGTVAMSFRDATHGTITLPGETPKSISRLNFARPANPRSLVGAYQMERSIVFLQSTNMVYDSDRNMSATGTMRIDDNSLTQSGTAVINGHPGSMTVSGSYTDLGTYFRLITSTGAVGEFHIVKRGDELTLMNASDEGTEVVTWRRTSSDPNASRHLAEPEPASGAAATGAPGIGAALAGALQASHQGR